MLSLNDGLFLLLWIDMDSISLTTSLPTVILNMIDEYIDKYSVVDKRLLLNCDYKIVYRCFTSAGRVYDVKTYSERIYDVTTYSDYNYRQLQSRPTRSIIYHKRKATAYRVPYNYDENRPKWVWSGM